MLWRVAAAYINWQGACALCAAEGGSLMAIQSNDRRITLVAGGYPLFVGGKIAGGIGVGGGTEEQDCEIAEYVLSVFEKEKIA